METATEIEITVSPEMERMFEYVQKQKQKHGFDTPPFSMQRSMYDSVRMSGEDRKIEEDMLALLNFLIEQGIPVPDIHPRIRTFSRTTRSHACRSYFAARRELSEQLQREGRSSQQVVFHPPVLAGAGN